MKRWLLGRRQQRLDGRHAAISPSANRCHARNLAFERCEDRLVLSGTPLTLDATPLTTQESGFITINSSVLIQGNTNNFLMDADNFNQIAGDVRVIDVDNSVGFGLQTPVDTPVDLPRINFDSAGNESLTVDDGTGNNLPDTVNDPPGLKGLKPQLLVIDEPIFLGSPSSADIRDLREAGSLEVATTVATTQRAYESKLSMVVASNLDRDGVLPPRAPLQAQPLVAELARTVVFETANQGDMAVDNEAKYPVQSPLDSPSVRNDPVSALLPASSARYETSPDHEHSTPTAGVANRTPTLRLGLSAENSEQALIPPERLDDKRLDAHATTFAQWPTLATVVASYLLIERNRPGDTQAVQSPPRRNRQAPVK